MIKPWKPKVEEPFRYIDRDGEIRTDMFTGSYQDKVALEFGNMYPLDSDQAERDVAWLKALRVLREDTKGFEPDWRDGGQAKWFVEYDFERGGLGTDCTTLWKAEPIHFATETDALESIKSHEKEWRVFLNVKE